MLNSYKRINKKQKYVDCYKTDWVSVFLLEDKKEYLQNIETQNNNLDTK